MMVPTIRHIAATDLFALEPLLRASFGRDDFDLQNEQEAFAELQPHDWFALWDEQPQGFIRYFGIAENLYLGELYTVPGAARRQRLEQLLQHFLDHHQLPEIGVLRLDVPATDQDSQRLLEARFPLSERKTFASYHVTAPHAKRVPAVPEKLSDVDLREVQRILAVLKQYSISELRQLDAQRQVYVFRDQASRGQSIKAALHAESGAPANLEIVTLATARDHLRQGSAAALLRDFLSANAGGRISLKVNTQNTAAIGLYEQAGFTRADAETETWWYLLLSRGKP